MPSYSLSDPHLIRILLIDDDADHVNLLREFLNGNGAPVHYELDAVDRLQAGLLSSSSGRYDLCILSLDLVGNKGLDAFYKFKSQSPSTPVIVLTDIRKENLALEAMRLGAQDYMIRGTIDARMLKHAIRFAIVQDRLDSTVQRLHTEDAAAAAPDE